MYWHNLCAHHGGFKFPSNWIAAVGALFVFIFYLIYLIDYWTSIGELGQTKIDEIKQMDMTDVDMDDIQMEFLQSQVEVLKR